MLQCQHSQKPTTCSVLQNDGSYRAIQSTCLYRPPPCELLHLSCSKSYKAKGSTCMRIFDQQWLLWSGSRPTISGYADMVTWMSTLVRNITLHHLLLKCTQWMTFVRICLHYVQCGIPTKLDCNSGEGSKDDTGCACQPCYEDLLLQFNLPTLFSLFGLTWLYILPPWTLMTERLWSCTYC